MQTWMIAFFLGVVALQLQATLPSSPWLLATGLIPLLLTPLNRRLAMLLAALLAGYLWALYIAQQQLSEVLPSGLEGEEIVLTGRIASLPEVGELRKRFLFVPEKLFHDGQEQLPPSLIRLNWYQGAPELVPGQLWMLKVKLKRPRGMLNPGSFDYEQWLFQQGIRATGYVRSSVNNRLLDDGEWNRSVQRLRYNLQQRLQKALAGYAQGGIIQALAIGDRSGITGDDWRLLLATGTNHLVAISGLHIGLVAGMIYFLFRQLWRLCPGCCLKLAAPRAAAISAIIAAVLYAALAGFSVPTQRAMLMLSLVMGAIILQRPVHPTRLLVLALFLVTLHDPLVVLAPGFWLSFSAVALILYGMRGRLNPAGIWWRWGRVQWLVALGLSPLLLLLFGKAAMVAPVANLIAVPWIGLLVVPFALAGTLLVSVWETGGSLLLQLAAWFTDLLWPLLALLPEILPALQQAAAPWWIYALALAGVGWLLMPRGWPLRWAGVVPLLPLFLWQPPSLLQGAARFTLLDVGQGLAAVVETRNHVLVFDTGPRFRSGFNTGSSVVVPFLQHRGREMVDALVVSHGDNDHIGGARSIVEELEVVRVLTSVPHKMGWISHAQCRRGDNWVWDGVQFELLHPGHYTHHGRGNNDSCVLKVSAGGEALLLTGDIELSAEQELITEYGEQLGADILVAPHHGSKSSSSADFIDAVTPRWVLFPLGYRNRYGFPHPSVSRRYAERGIGMFDTSSSGAISVILGQGLLAPREYRIEARHYWQSP